MRLTSHARNRVLAVGVMQVIVVTLLLGATMPHMLRDRDARMLRPLAGLALAPDLSRRGRK